MAKEDTLTGDIQPLMSDAVDPVQEEQFDADARAIAKVGRDPKWQVIINYCQDRVSLYRDDLAGMDLSGDDLRRVGEKYIVCNLVAQELNALLEKVKATTEAVNESERRKS